MYVIDTETGYTIIRVGYDIGPQWQVGHQDSVGVAVLTKSRFDFTHCIGMLLQAHPEGASDCLSGFVIMSGTYATKAEADIIAFMNISKFLAE